MDRGEGGWEVLADAGVWELWGGEGLDWGGKFLALVTRGEGVRQKLWEAGPIVSWRGEMLGTRRGSGTEGLQVTWWGWVGELLVTREEQWEPEPGAMGAGQVEEGGGEVVLVSGDQGAGYRATGEV